MTYTRKLSSGRITWSYKFDLPVSTKANRKQAQAHGFSSQKAAVSAEAVRREQEAAAFVGPSPKRSAHVRGDQNPRWRGGRKIQGGYVLILMHEHPKANCRGYVREHNLIAEKALGKPLPPGAVVHHVNRNRADNQNSNLVICQSAGYHSLLHSRMRSRA